MFSRQKYTLVSSNKTNKKGSQTQKEDVFIAFKDRIKDKIKDDEFTHQDHYLKKWLIARDWDLEKAVTMFTQSYEFRQKRDIDNLLTKYDPPEVLKKYRPGGICGWDRGGSPVLYELHGYTDLKGLMHSARRRDLENTKLHQCEQTVQIWREESKKRGQIVDGITMVLDCEKVGTQFLWRPGLNLMTSLTELLEDNYPEMVKKMIVVNAPGIFPILYNLCRPTLSESMKRKILVLGKNFGDHLKQYISEEELPAYLGGKKTDPDGNPRCTTWINQGGTVPTSYYLTELRNSDEMKTIDVPHGNKSFLKFNVEQTGCFLQWEFMTEEYDIAYRVEFSATENDKGEREILVPTQRVNSHLAPEDGSHQCLKSGFYYLVLDNTFSWTRSKQVSYTAGIVEGVDSNVTVQKELQSMMT